MPPSGGKRGARVSPRATGRPGAAVLTGRGRAVTCVLLCCRPGVLGAGTMSDVISCSALSSKQV